MHPYYYIDLYVNELHEMSIPLRMLVNKLALNWRRALYIILFSVFIDVVFPILLLRVNFTTTSIE